MVFCSITSSILVVISNKRGDFEQERQQLRHRDLIGGAGMDRFADRAERLGEIFDPIGVRHVACLEMDLGHPQIVSADESDRGFPPGTGAPCARAAP